jgi:hypothetical protein
MTGKHNIFIDTGRVRFDLTLDRNITIITGDSAIGKTYLCDTVRVYIRLGKSSGIYIKTDVQLGVGADTLEDAVWQLKNNNGTVIFYDEDLKYVMTKEFAEAVKGSDNYIVIICREAIKNLPYSIKAVKSLVTKKTNGIFVSEFVEIFNLHKLEKFFQPELIITEDKKSGFEFFDLISNCKCDSADGNGNVTNKLKSCKNYNNILVIVDGAAFGPLYMELMDYINVSNQKIVVWMPESFEFLILQSGVVKHEKLNYFLQETYNYADSCEYESWEQYYTALLNELCQYNNIGTYTKSTLLAYFKRKPVVDKITEKFPKELIF